MSEPIGVGDWVECIDPEEDETEPNTMEIGGIYQVSETLESWECNECGSTMGLHIAGQPTLGNVPFCVCQFRPIYRPSASLIEDLSAPHVRR